MGAVWWVLVKVEGGMQPISEGGYSNRERDLREEISE